MAGPDTTRDIEAIPTTRPPTHPKTVVPAEAGTHFPH